MRGTLQLLQICSNFKFHECWLHWSCLLSACWSSHLNQYEMVISFCQSHVNLYNSTAEFITQYNCIQVNLNFHAKKSCPRFQIANFFEQFTWDGIQILRFPFRLWNTFQASLEISEYFLIYIWRQQFQPGSQSGRHVVRRGQPLI